MKNEQNETTNVRINKRKIVINKKQTMDMKGQSEIAY